MPRDSKVVVITGAGSGIGAAIAAEAARDGALLVLAGRRIEALNEVAATLPAARRPLIVQADVTTADGRQSLREACLRAGGRVDLLINNAGVVRTGPIRSMSDKAVMDMLHTNLAAPLLLSRDLLPFLKRSANPRIVNVGSMFGDIAFPLFAAYSASKFGLRGLSDALRRELAPEGVGVTYAAPRAVNTPAAREFEGLVAPFAMKLDDPRKVARRIWRGAVKGKRTIYPAGPERIFVLVQQLFPGVIEGSIVKQFSRHLATLPAPQDAAAASAGGTGKSA